MGENKCRIEKITIQQKQKNRQLKMASRSKLHEIKQSKALFVETKEMSGNTRTGDLIEMLPNVVVNVSVIAYWMDSNAKQHFTFTPKKMPCFFQLNFCRNFVRHLRFPSQFFFIYLCHLVHEKEEKKNYLVSEFRKCIQIVFNHLVLRCR